MSWRAKLARWIAPQVESTLIQVGTSDPTKLIVNGFQVNERYISYAECDIVVRPGYELVISQADHIVKVIMRKVF